MLGSLGLIQLQRSAMQVFRHFVKGLEIGKDGLWRQRGEHGQYDGNDEGCRLFHVVFS